MNHIDLAEHIKKSGAIFMGYERYKKYDAIFYARPPNISYARLGLDCHLDEVPDSTWQRLFPIKEKEENKN